MTEPRSGETLDAGIASIGCHPHDLVRVGRHEHLRSHRAFRQGIIARFERETA